MQEFPHHYAVTAAADSASADVSTTASRLPTLSTNAPEEFGGPGDRWSPETLLVAALADCFVLSFRAIARFSKLPWQRLSCSATGVLDRVERKTRFTGFRLRVRLELPDGVDPGKAERLVHKAEESCLISNSLNAAVELELEILEGVGATPTP